MTFNLDDLTWTCHVCGDERPDARISVISVSRPMRCPADTDGDGNCASCAHDELAHGSVQVNTRYCNDRAACQLAAPDIGLGLLDRLFDPPPEETPTS